jgi:hypothetical protein
MQCCGDKMPVMCFNNCGFFLFETSFKLLNGYLKVLDHSKDCLVWLLFDCIAGRKCYILLFVL